MSKIKVDRISNRAGTGAPEFINGIKVVGLTSVADVVGVAALSCLSNSLFNFSFNLVSFSKSVLQTTIPFILGNLICFYVARDLETHKVFYNSFIINFIECFFSNTMFWIIKSTH